MNEQSESTCPVPVGMVGLGGYAGSMCRLLLGQKPSAEPALQLSAVYEPNLAPHGELLEQLKARGVQIMPSYEALLELPLAVIWLPIPIHLHKPFAEQALAAGRNVLVEKPVTGTIEDMDALIAARDRSGRGVAVGFQDIYDPILVGLKRQLLDGAIGRIERLSVTGCWPRSTAYYARNGWAGRMRVDGTWILDSPVNNAMAHFVNLGAFLVGPTLEQSARPTRVEAELYRAYPIENYDTAAIRVTLADGPDMTVLMTHACGTASDPTITLHGSKGRCRIVIARQYHLETAGGSRSVDLSRNNRWDMVRKIARWSRGEPTDGPVCTLEIARTHTLIVNGASDAAAVRTLPDETWETVPAKDGSQRVIHGIEATVAACAESGQLFHESGRHAWTAAPGSCDLTAYTRFRGAHAPQA